MSDDKPYTKVHIESQVGWSGLLRGAEEYVRKCRWGELCAWDAERLEGLARAIRIKLEEADESKSR